MNVRNGKVVGSAQIIKITCKSHKKSTNLTKCFRRYHPSRTPPTTIEEQAHQDIAGFVKRALITCYNSIRKIVTRSLFQFTFSRQNSLGRPPVSTAIFQRLCSATQPAVEARWPHRHSYHLRTLLSCRFIPF